MSKHDDNHIEISCPIDFERRKRLGQYFTGTGLGRLLAALAQAEKADSIIDPMVGSGDLLASCIEIDAKPAVMAGIEIDMKVHKACSKRLPHAHCLLGNAFDRGYRTVARKIMGFSNRKSPLCSLSIPSG